MSEIAQVTAILGMFFMSYVGLRAFGKPTTRLLFSSEEKKKWNALLQSSFGNWLTGTNIVGTLTSFATVLVFFLGNAKVFGLWVLICSFSIWIGGYVTNYFTRRISALPKVHKLLNSENQTGGVLASLCWSNSRTGRTSATWVKHISLANISAVIWLEFSLFSDIGGDIFGVSQLWVKATAMFVSSFAVIYFVLRYGIRGFAFADVFQAPIIAFSAVLIAGGAIWQLNTSAIRLDLTAMQPLADGKTILLFVIHVLFLNAFLVLATEPHWLRLWVFQNKESDTQVASTFSTAVIWAILIAIGLIASAISGGGAGTGVIVGLVGHLSDLSPVFVVAFWFAAVSALFSTADSQAYSWLVVRNFDTASGQLRESKLGSIRPVTYAMASAAAFSLIYVAVRTYSIPFEKLVFLIIPFSLNTLPAIVQLANGREPTPALMIASVVLFIALGSGGFLQPSSELFWTLSAALAPVLISLAAPFLGKKMET